VVGEPQVLTGPDLTAGYAVDWTGRFRGRTPAVVRPSSVDEVAGVLAACREHDAAVVPQGGNTGLSGGGVPLDGEVVLSTRRLASVESDPAAGQLTAGAGASLGTVIRCAEAGGFSYGVDLSARDSATVGGTVATNAGGTRFLRHGGTREQLLGVEAVLGSGLVVSHLSGVPKDNTGYDLAGLLCGSEGTLGVVTRARLRLVERLEVRATALVGFATAEQAVQGTADLRACGAPLESLELVWDATLRLVCSAFGLPAPLPEPAGHRVYLLVECAGHADPLPALAEAVASLGGVGDAAVASDPLRRAALWRYREEAAAAIATAGVPVKMDVAVAPAALAELAARVTATVATVAPGAAPYLFGHAADGNLHVNVVPPPGSGARDTRAIEDAVYRVVHDLGGSISAEHGIGRAKLPWIHLSRSPDEIAAFRALKQAMDPDGILNPGVLLPPG
jgi:FAD/FMN-containing dehydrogenase